jgi:hypothetical protein
MALRGFVKCLADGHNYANTLLAAGFLAGGSQPEKGSVPRLCFGKKFAANVPNAYFSADL